MCLAIGRDDPVFGFSSADDHAQKSLSPLFCPKCLKNGPRTGSLFRFRFSDLGFASSGCGQRQGNVILVDRQRAAGRLREITHQTQRKTQTE